MIILAENESAVRIAKDIPYLTLTGELLGVYCEDFRENWPRYNGTTLYCEQINWKYMVLLSCLLISQVEQGSADITDEVVSYEHHGGSNHQQRDADWWFNSQSASNVVNRSPAMAPSSYNPHYIQPFYSTNQPPVVRSQKSGSSPSTFSQSFRPITVSVEGNMGLNWIPFSKTLTKSLGLIIPQHSLYFWGVLNLVLNEICIWQNFLHFACNSFKCKLSYWIFWISKKI